MTAGLLLEDWAEERLLCRSELCQRQFIQNLQALGIRDYQLQTSPLAIQLQAQTPLYSIKIKKELQPELLEK